MDGRRRGRLLGAKHMLEQALEAVTQMRIIGDELRDIDNRRRVLVNLLNKYASGIEYAHDDYDTAVAVDQFCDSIAEISDLSYRGHQPGRDPFWIPSSQVC